MAACVVVATALAVAIGRGPPGEHNVVALHARELELTLTEADQIDRWLCGEDVEKPAALDAPGAWAAVDQTISRDPCGFPNASTTDYRFAMFKTHKTASSSLEILMAGVANNKKLRFLGCDNMTERNLHFNTHIGCPAAFESVSTQPPRFGMEFRHAFSGTVRDGDREESWYRGDAAESNCDQGDGRWFDQAIASYRLAIGSDVPLVIPIRSAESHVNSVMDFYFVTLDMMRNDSTHYANPANKDLRLLTEEHMRSFVQRWLSNCTRGNTTVFCGPGGVQLVPVVQDWHNESLVTLRRTLGWSWLDVVHGEEVSHDQGEAPPPPPPPLPRWTYALDDELFEGFNGVYQRAKAAVYDATFDREVLAVSRLSDATVAACRDGSLVDVRCRYLVYDNFTAIQYEGTVEKWAMQACHAESTEQSVNGP